jgi:hypothetical protein
VCIALAFIAAISLNACGKGGGGGGSYAGKWQLDKAATKSGMEAQLKKEAKDNNEEYDPNAANMLNAMVDGMVFEVELKGDHTFSAHMVMPFAGDESRTGTWKSDGNGILLTAENETEPGRMELKGGKLHMVSDGDSPPLVLQRKQE